MRVAAQAGEGQSSCGWIAINLPFRATSFCCRPVNGWRAKRFVANPETDGETSDQRTGAASGEEQHRLRRSSARLRRAARCAGRRRSRRARRRAIRRPRGRRSASRRSGTGAGTRPARSTARPRRPAGGRPRCPCGGLDADAERRPVAGEPIEQDRAPGPSGSAIRSTGARLAEQALRPRRRRRARRAVRGIASHGGATGAPKPSSPAWRTSRAGQARARSARRPARRGRSPG